MTKVPWKKVLQFTQTEQYGLIEVAMKWMAGLAVLALNVLLIMAILLRLENVPYLFGTTILVVFLCTWMIEDIEKQGVDVRRIQEIFKPLVCCIFCVEFALDKVPQIPSSLKVVMISLCVALALASILQSANRRKWI